MRKHAEYFYQNIYQILSFSLSARKRKGAWNDWSERDFPSLLLPFTIYSLRLLTEFSIPPAGSPHIHESCPHSTSFIIYTNTSIHCHPLCHSCLSLSRIGPSHLASPLHQRETIHDQECERYLIHEDICSCLIFWTVHGFLCIEKFATMRNECYKTCHLV